MIEKGKSDDDDHNRNYVLYFVPCSFYAIPISKRSGYYKYQTKKGR